ncbi:MAG: hypothetical protein WKG07_49080 [Hymenobacter sp.]
MVFPKHRADPDAHHRQLPAPLPAGMKPPRRRWISSTTGSALLYFALLPAGPLPDGTGRAPLAQNVADLTMLDLLDKALSCISHLSRTCVVLAGRFLREKRGW